MTVEPWYIDHSNLLKVGHYLVDEEGVTAEELLYFFEKPWKWSDTYAKVTEPDPLHTAYGDTRLRDQLGAPG